MPYEQASAMITKLAGFDADCNIEELKFRAKLRNMFASHKDEAEEVLVVTPELVASMNTGLDPYNYLASRGFTEETIKYFECTFTDKWGPVWNKTENIYRLEERVVIPGHDEFGKLAGFIGRSPVGDEPKYRYLKHYPKSKMIFNLHRAKKHVGKNGLIVVEGPADSMNVHQLGKPNVGSIYGAKISEEQIKLICKTTDKVFLMFDGDAAGKTAMLQGVERLADEVHEVNIVGLGPFKDPGEIKTPEQLQFLLDNSLNWRSFKIKQSLQRSK
jgi:DNA primase